MEVADEEKEGERGGRLRGTKDFKRETPGGKWRKKKKKKKRGENGSLDKSVEGRKEPHSALGPNSFHSVAQVSRSHQCLSKQDPLKKALKAHTKSIYVLK